MLKALLGLHPVSFETVSLAHSPPPTSNNQPPAAAPLQAHIMNDEATRKFIQAIKRLMTFCQRRYPTDPSRECSGGGSTAGCMVARWPAG